MKTLLKTIKFIAFNDDLKIKKPRLKIKFRK
jgi:hypothetical protein